MRAKKHFEDLNTSEIDKKNSSEIEYSEEKNDIYTALKLLSEEEKAVILLCYTNLNYMLVQHVPKKI